jgi:hypothetical protein
MEALIKSIQKRVANIAIGVPTLRGQGKGTIAEAREFLAKLNLRRFKDISEAGFNKLIDKLTEDLMRQFPSCAVNNWGAARKSINVFLERMFPLKKNAPTSLTI